MAGLQEMLSRVCMSQACGSTSFIFAVCKSVATKSPATVCTVRGWITDMRWTMAISVALLLALGAYAGSADVSLDGLVQAAQSGDAAAVMSRTDLPRLKRSLVDQIVAAYLNWIEQKRAVTPLERLAANTYGASIADVMVGKLLTQERLTELLNSGKVSLDASYLRFLSWGMGQLSQVAPSRPPRNCETN